MVFRFFKTMLKANYPEDFSSRALPVLQLLVISILSLVSKFKKYCDFRPFYSDWMVGLAPECIFRKPQVSANFLRKPQVKRFSQSLNIAALIRTVLTFRLAISGVVSYKRNAGSVRYHFSRITALTILIKFGTKLEGHKRWTVTRPDFPEKFRIIQ